MRLLFLVRFRAVNFEIAPGFASEDWLHLRSQLPEDGAWPGTEAKWSRAIEAIRTRIEKRYFASVSCLRSSQHAGFAVLALDCLLLETIESFRNGRRASNSGESRAACIRLLTESPHFRAHFNEERASRFFAAVRNGLLHDGETRDGWLVKRSKRYSIVQDLGDGYIVVNRNKFHAAIEAEFGDYISGLSVPENTELRMNLVKALDDLCNRSRPRNSLASGTR